LKVKIAFPELFKTSLACDVQYNKSENNTTWSIVEAIEELTSVSDRGGLGSNCEDENVLESKLPSILTIYNYKYPDYLNQY
jgi:hypothetical protein